MTLKSTMEETERRLIAETIRQHGYNITKSAAELGIHRKTLWLKMKRHNIASSHQEYLAKLARLEPQIP
jgi:transcriptional regulator with PAS, ATPase and Fis domain